MKQVCGVLVAAVMVVFVSTVWAGEFDHWTEALVSRAELEAPALQTAADADGWGRVMALKFYREFFFPTVGRVEVGAYGVSTRDYQSEDLHGIARATERMIAILKQVHSRIPVNGHDSHLAHLELMLQKIKEKMTPAGRYQQEMLQRPR